jgi:hypothetical protein
MWDRSFRWQRWARLGAGALALVAAGAGAVSFAQTAPAARARAGLAEIARETNPDAQARVSVELPAGLGARRGGLVYRENSDGSGDIVGRVIDVAPAGADTQRVTILLTPAASGMLAHGGKVRGAAPTLNVEHAELLNATVGDLRKELAPLEEQLLNKLANRAWEVIGVSGVAEGVLRKAGDGAKNTYNDAKEWVKGWFGKKEEVERQNRDFLTEEKATALRIALEEEVEKFLKDNDREIKAAFNKVLNERRRDFIQKFETRWGPKLYEKAIVPSWFDGEDAVIAAAESYANDFARRRLLTERGGPRLLLAYALRTSLDISDDPLLVIAPARTGTVEFEWIMPRLAKDSR